MAKLPVPAGLSELYYIPVLSLCRPVRISCGQQEHHRYLRVDILVVHVDYVHGAFRLSDMVRSLPVSLFWRVVSARRLNQGSDRQDGWLAKQNVRSQQEMAQEAQEYLASEHSFLGLVHL